MIMLRSGVAPCCSVYRLMVTVFFLYCFTAFHTPVFALIIAMLAHIHIVIALTAVPAEVLLIFRIFHAHAVTALRFRFTAVDTLLAGFALLCHTEGHRTFAANMLFPFTALNTDVTAGAVKIFCRKNAAQLAKSAVIAYFKTVIKQANIARLAYKTAILTVSRCYLAHGNVFITFTTFKAVLFVIICRTVIAIAAVFAYFTHTAAAAKAGFAHFILASVKAAFAINAVGSHLPITFLTGKTVLAYRFTEEAALTAQQAMVQIIHVAVLAPSAFLAPHLIRKAFLTVVAM